MRLSKLVPSLGQVQSLEVFGDCEESSSLTVKPIDPSKPLKAPLVWTDALGHDKGGKLPAWVNDLDLVVPGARKSYLGNVFKRLAEPGIQDRPGLRTDHHECAAG